MLSAALGWGAPLCWGALEPLFNSSLTSTCLSALCAGACSPRYLLAVCAAWSSELGSVVRSACPSWRSTCMYTLGLTRASWGVCACRTPWETRLAGRAASAAFAVDVCPGVSRPSVIPLGNTCLYSQRVVHDRARYAGRPHQRDACLRLVKRFPRRAWGKQKGLHEFSEKIESKCYVSLFSAFLLNHILCSSFNAVISSV